MIIISAMKVRFFVISVTNIPLVIRLMKMILFVGSMTMTSVVRVMKRLLPSCPIFCFHPRAWNESPCSTDGLGGIGQRTVALETHPSLVGGPFLAGTWRSAPVVGPAHLSRGGREPHVAAVVAGPGPGPSLVRCHAHFGCCVLATRLLRRIMLLEDSTPFVHWLILPKSVTGCVSMRHFRGCRWHAASDAAPEDCALEGAGVPWRCCDLIGLMQTTAEAMLVINFM